MSPLWGLIIGAGVAFSALLRLRFYGGTYSALFRLQGGVAMGVGFACTLRQVPAPMAVLVQWTVLEALLWYAHVRGMFDHDDDSHRF